MRVIVNVPTFAETFVCDAAWIPDCGDRATFRGRDYRVETVEQSGGTGRDFEVTLTLAGPVRKPISALTLSVACVFAVLTMLALALAYRLT